MAGTAGVREGGAPRTLPTGALLLGLGLAGAGAVRLFGLDRLGFALCTFKAVTGLPCVTCGSTRTLARLAHLDLVGALAMNPLATVLAVAVLAWGLADLVALARRGEAARPGLPPALRRVLLPVAVAAALFNWAYLIAAGR